MRGGLRIGRLFGIDIHVDVGWLLIFLLITWTLSVVFDQRHEDWSTGFSWGLGAVAALIFFGSILLHEMAHSLVAKAQGIPVKRITLFLFGGVSNIQKDPTSPSREFFMTIVGPITSLVLGFVFFAIGVSVASLPEDMGDGKELISQLGPAATVLFWLGSVNILIGLFNLLPGFPLDGGRLLRAALWAVTGNLKRATRWASWAGQSIAFLLIFMGVSMIFGVSVPIFGTGMIGGFWLVILGWFLNSASTSSYEQLVIKDALGDMEVSRLMRTDPDAVGSDCPVSELVHEHIMKRDDSSFPVIDDGRLLGLVTLHDVRRTPRENWDGATVRDIMTKDGDLETARPDENLAGALEKLTRRDVRQLPVVSDGRLVGMLRRRDIVKWLQLESDVQAPGR